MFPKREDIPEGHSFQETSDLWPDDTLLRRFGFQIEHRPKTGPAIWSRHGEHFTEKAALRIARSEQEIAEDDKEHRRRMQA